jgi:hypothetical protein
MFDKNARSARRAREQHKMEDPDELDILMPDAYA